MGNTGIDAAHEEEQQKFIRIGANLEGMVTGTSNIGKLFESIQKKKLFDVRRKVKGNYCIEFRKKSKTLWSHLWTNV